MWFDAGGILIGAAVLDFCIGDPWGWIHPVQVMGWTIEQFKTIAFRLTKNSVALRILGAGLTIALIFGSAAIAFGMIELAKLIHPGLGMAIAMVLLASCFAGRSLRKAAEEVLGVLNDLDEARSRLRLYVGRDTENLSRSEILRAILETVTENAVDGVMAPLFYALVGSFTPVGSVGLAIAFKAASTLDSMIGYREAPYTDFGWFSAKTDDILTWLPCRLTVFTLGLISGQPFRVWNVCQRDAPQDSSPNSGWSECVYAASLGVQVGGVNYYRGVEKRKPLLGDPLQPITIDTIHQAMNLTRSCFLVWLFFGLFLHYVI
ncbi:adenosylcobinamide-phosphate synthase CbiB [Leptolyngbya sp. NIES-2104]|uniref:adenosylcobinamide-phosphate synthase CbiB n=1 Tax=Leptolyngbya sp. NIES-2104 TaxID=1552121 RepID=UPI0006EC591E|nr:adenosylcobinamide-phosphate synthase CbiB [Leptolyngbya sp. NIES-2104]GAP97354.1 adenosylcobinamide-phosphate synthase [Leptolyngbya sp. NIES-2104]